MLCHLWKRLSELCMLMLCNIITARKRSLRRLCFHRCLSVHGGDAWRGACVAGVCRTDGERACMVGGGGAVCMAGESATAAGSTHHTGMHSCLKSILFSDNYVCYWMVDLGPWLHILKGPRTSQGFGTMVRLHCPTPRPMPKKYTQNQWKFSSVWI